MTKLEIAKRAQIIEEMKILRDIKLKQERNALNRKTKGFRKRRRQSKMDI